MPKGKGYSSPKGMYSSKKNPMPQPKRVEPMMGPGGNADQKKANRLMKQAHDKHESLRGKMGM